MSPALQPDAVHAGRPRPRQAADDLGRGPGRRQGHRREDRPGRLRRDGHRATPAAGSSTDATYARGGRMQGSTSDGKVTATLNNAATKAPSSSSRTCAGRTTRWAPPSTRLGHDQPGVRRRPDRHVHRRLRRLHRAGPEQQPEPRRLRPHGDPARRSTRTPACSAAAPSPRSTSTTTEAERDAAVKWIDFYYMQKLLDAGGRRRRRQGARRQQPAGRHARRCRSSTRRPTTSRRPGSRTTSTSRSTR